MIGTVPARNNRPPSSVKMRSGRYIATLRSRVTPERWMNIETVV